MVSPEPWCPRNPNLGGNSVWCPRNLRNLNTLHRFTAHTNRVPVSFLCLVFLLVRDCFLVTDGIQSSCQRIDLVLLRFRFGL